MEHTQHPIGDDLFIEEVSLKALWEKSLWILSKIIGENKVLK